MAVYIIILAIIIASLAFCVFLLKHKQKPENIVAKNLVVPLIITLLGAFIWGCIDLTIGNPVIAIKEWLVSVEAIPKPTSAPTPTFSPQPYIEPTFAQRTSEQFNYKIDYPSDFILEGAQGQNQEDDFNLTSTDYKATLNFTARYISGELPEKYTLSYFQRTYAGTVLLDEGNLEEDGWYAVSTKAADGFFHYRKCIFTDGIVRMYTFSFPTDQEDKYLTHYDYVSHIEKSFRKLH